MYNLCTCTHEPFEQELSKGTLMLKWPFRYEENNVFQNTKQQTTILKLGG